MHKKGLGKGTTGAEECDPQTPKNHQSVNCSSLNYLCIVFDREPRVHDFICLVRKEQNFEIFV